MIWEIDRSKDLRILLRSYLHNRFWITKVQNNSRAHLRNKSGFLKYNNILLGNIVQYNLLSYKNRSMNIKNKSGVYSFSKTVEIFSQNYILKNRQKGSYTFQTPSFALCKKLSNFLSFFYLSYPKALYKSVPLSSKNVAFRNLASLIIPKSVF